AGSGAGQTPLAKWLWLSAQVGTVGRGLSAAVPTPRSADPLVAPSLTCSVTVVTPRPTRVPAVGVCVIESGVELLQSVATTPLVKLGTGHCYTPVAKTLRLRAAVGKIGGVLSVTVWVAVELV